MSPPHLVGIETCALCPRLCRHACPVAEGTRREAAVPAILGEALLAWRRGRLDDDDARQAATLCVDCGACQRACHLHRPLPALLREARAALVPEPSAAPLGAIEGEGDLVAVEPDERRWAEVLAERLGRPVARLRTGDFLGAALRGFSGWEARASRLRERFHGRTAVVSDGASAGALEEAGVVVHWLDALVPELAGGRPSCARGGGDCCGGAWPLSTHHPDDARRMAHRWARVDADTADARCTGWLARQGLSAHDAIHRLLEGP